jgi:two-component system sensor histidine kinase GlrK
MREGAELLAEGVVGQVNAQQLEIIQILQDKTRRLQELIENLLNFSMAHARNAALSRQSVPLHRLLDEVATDHKPVMLAKDMVLDLSSSEILVFGDDEKLRAVIDNLFSNAVKYSPEGGTIQVSLQRQDDCAVLDVVDAGPGLDDTDKDKIFEAFYQGEIRSEGSVMQGNGLGLAIVREYLSAHEGTIELLDHLPGGAHFRVTLPCTDSPGASAKDSL